MRILIADDDKEIRKTYSKLIMKAGFEAASVEAGDMVLDSLEKEHFDMLVLDVQMPGIDGLTLTKMLRDTGSSIPILITSNHHSHQDIDAGLLSGADDYMIKPVEAEEFILRIKAILRRAHVNTSHSIQIGSTCINSDTRIVTVGSCSYMLPHKEFELLFFLLSYPDKVFSREYLMNEIWGPDTDSEPATVNVHINRLRKHFAMCPEFSIQTCRGAGYRIHVTA